MWYYSSCWILSEIYHQCCSRHGFCSCWQPSPALDSELLIQVSWKRESKSSLREFEDGDFRPTNPFPSHRSNPFPDFLYFALWMNEYWLRTFSRTQITYKNPDIRVTVWTTLLMALKVVWCLLLLKVITKSWITEILSLTSGY